MTTNDERKVALRRRTKAFASTVVRFYIGLDKRREELRTLGKQLLRAGTSVAANYRESSRARSVDEFVAKAEICIQEADDEPRGEDGAPFMARPARMMIGGCPLGAEHHSRSCGWNCYAMTAVSQPKSSCPSGMKPTS